jgi:predicted dehydrogenase
LERRKEAAAPRDLSNGGGTRKEKLCVGVVGAGGFANAVLIPTVKAQAACELVGICTATTGSAQSAARKFGFTYGTTAYHELLADARVDTVVIATRHHLHAAQVVAALEAGKAVFCEKPIALNAGELAEIAAAYQARPGSFVTVGYNRRFAPMVRQMKDFLANAGEPFAMHYRINAGHIPADHWIHEPEQGGGRLTGEVCHFIDLLTFLAGASLLRVETTALPNSGRYRDDNLLITMHFEDGSVGTVSYLANGDKSFSKERLEIFGGGCVAVLDDFRRLELRRDGRGKTYQSRLRQDKGHAAEWNAFVSARRDGLPAPVNFEEIRQSTLAVFAAVESLRRGSSVSLREELRRV